MSGSIGFLLWLMINIFREGFPSEIILLVGTLVILVLLSLIELLKLSVRSYRNKGGFVSEYAASKIQEDFPETYVHYALGLFNFDREALYEAGTVGLEPATGVMKAHTEQRGDGEVREIREEDSGPSLFAIPSPTKRDIVTVL